MQPHILRDPGIEDRGGPHTKCDAPDGTGVWGMGVGADDHLPGKRVRLENLGMTDGFRAVMTEAQLTVQLDALHGRKLALLLLEL